MKRRKNINSSPKEKIKTSASSGYNDPIEGSRKWDLVRPRDRNGLCRISYVTRKKRVIYGSTDSAASNLLELLSSTPLHLSSSLYRSTPTPRHFLFSTTAGFSRLRPCNAAGRPPLPPSSSPRRTLGSVLDRCSCNHRDVQWQQPAAAAGESLAVRGGGGGGCCSSAGSPRTTRTRHWPTTLDLASSLLFPASLMHYTRLSGLRPCTSPPPRAFSSFFPIASSTLPLLYFDRTQSSARHFYTHPAFFLYIYIYMYKSNVKVHLPPSISLHFPTSAFPARPSSSWRRKARVSRFVIARTHLSMLRVSLERWMLREGGNVWERKRGRIPLANYN